VINQEEGRIRREEGKREEERGKNERTNERTRRKPKELWVSRFMLICVSFLLFLLLLFLLLSFLLSIIFPLLFPDEDIFQMEDEVKSQSTVTFKSEDSPKLSQASIDTSNDSWSEYNTRHSPSPSPSSFLLPPSLCHCRCPCCPHPHPLPLSPEVHQGIHW
jgi:cytoskeletal protein RodZ